MCNQRMGEDPGVMEPNSMGKTELGCQKGRLARFLPQSVQGEALPSPKPGRQPPFTTPAASFPCPSGNFHLPLSIIQGSLTAPLWIHDLPAPDCLFSLWPLHWHCICDQPFGKKAGKDIEDNITVVIIKWSPIAEGVTPDSGSPCTAHRIRMLF